MKAQGNVHKASMEDKRTLEGFRGASWKASGSAFIVMDVLDGGRLLLVVASETPYMYHGKTYGDMVCGDKRPCQSKHKSRHTRLDTRLAGKGRDGLQFLGDQLEGIGK